jgi:D-threo-aldose 1-dehydrogenase
MLAGRYTLLDQSAMDHVLPLAQKRGVAVILGGVFNGGLIADPGESDQFDHRPADDRHKHRAALIAEIGARHGVSAAAAGIQFAAAHPAVASVVVGVRSPGELVDDLRLAESTIDESFWGELISAGIIRADAPIPSDASLLEEAAG